jgi:iron(III) transport system substrate-binding protein
MRRVGWLVLIAVTLGLVSAPVARAAEEQVVVYTALEEDEAKAYLDQLKKDDPALHSKVKWIRLSTGVLASRIEAERANPQADVIWGTFNDFITGMAKKGLIEPYDSPEARALSPRYKHPEKYWAASTVLNIALAVNTEQLKKLNLPEPRTWEDLAKPVYKGQIVTANPSTSGTAYLVVAGLLTKYGEEKGWDYLSRLDKNVSQYTKSGGAPGRMAAQGETAVGITFEFEIFRFAKAGHPVKAIFPQDGVPWTMEANALVKGAKNPQTARKFIDWALSRSAAKAYAGWRGWAGAVTRSDVDLGQLPKAPGAIVPVNMDFTWAAENKDRIVKKWLSMFGR